MRTPRLLLPAVAYRDLTSRFDSGALNRGIAYAQEQRLAAVSWFPDDSVIEAEVAGTDSYSVHVELAGASTPRELDLLDLPMPARSRAEELQWFTPTACMCTCPVGRDCKHAAALLRWTTSLASVQKFGGVGHLSPLASADLSFVADCVEKSTGHIDELDVPIRQLAPIPQDRRTTPACENPVGWPTGLSGAKQAAAGDSTSGAWGEEPVLAEDGGEVDPDLLFTDLPTEDPVRKPEPAWRQALRFLRVPDAPARGGLAIAFELQRRISWFEQRAGAGTSVSAADALDPNVQLVIRPMRRGQRDAWIKGGLTWRSLMSGGDAALDPEQATILGQIYRLHLSEGVGRAMREDHIDLADTGSRLMWELLERAQQMGVEFIGLAPIESVQWGDTASAEFSIASAEGARAHGGLQLTPALSIDGEPVRRPKFLGPYALADFILPGDGAGRDGPGASGGSGVRVRIARLDRPAHEGLQRLLLSDGFDVPTEDRQEFFDEGLTVLSQAASVVSADSSVELPDSTTPHLTLTASFTGDHVDLSWQWKYQLPTRRLPLNPPVGSGDVGSAGVPGSAGVSGQRNIEAERDILMEVHRQWPDQAREDTLSFDGVEAAQFTAEVLPQLEASPLIEVSVFGTRPDYVHIEGTPNVSAVVNERNDWFDLAMSVHVGDRELPFATVFTALARGQDAVLMPDKSYIKLDHPVFDKLRDLIREATVLQEWSPTKQRIDKHQVGQFKALEDIADTIEGDTGWFERIRALAQVEELPTAPLPAELKATLRDYQCEGFQWLSFLYGAGLGGILADDMGLGKTIQTLALIAHARETAAGAAAETPAGTSAPAGTDHSEEADDRAGTSAPFLVVAPSSVVGVWQAEAARFTPGLDVRVVSQTSKKRGTPLEEARSGADVIVTSYTLMRRDSEEYTKLPWAGAVFDEAQAVKNLQSKGFAAASKIQAPFRLVITGTPMENALADFWSLLRIAVPGLVGPYRRFNEEFAKPIESGEAPERMLLLRQTVRPFMLRRTKELVAKDLPEKQESIISVELTPAHAKAYNTLLQRERKKVLRLLDDMDVDGNRMTVFRSLTLLRMMALDPAIVEGGSYSSIESSKMQTLLESLGRVIDEGHRVIVFSQFTSFLQRISDELTSRGAAHLYLDGSVPMSERADLVTAFQEGSAPVFLISLKAGGAGLTLTAADYVFIMDPWWNPAAEAQAVDRAHRIGQDKKVMVYRLVALGTIEEKVVDLQQRKARLFDSLMDGGAGFARGISADDLRELFGGGSA